MKPILSISSLRSIKSLYEILARRDFQMGKFIAAFFYLRLFCFPLSTTSSSHAQSSHKHKFAESCSFFALCYAWEAVNIVFSRSFSKIQKPFNSFHLISKWNRQSFHSYQQIIKKRFKEVSALE